MAPRKSAPSGSPDDTVLTEMGNTELEILGEEVEGESPVVAQPSPGSASEEEFEEGGSKKTKHRTPGYFESDEEDFPDVPAESAQPEELGKGKRIKKPVVLNNGADSGPSKSKAKKTTRNPPKKNPGKSAAKGKNTKTTAKKPATRDASDAEDDPIEESEDEISPAAMRQEIAGLVGQSLRVAVTFAQFLRDRLDLEDGLEEEADQMDRDVTTLIRNRKRKAGAHESEKVVKKRATASKKK